jgi:hypothetical protein
MNDDYYKRFPPYSFPKGRGAFKFLFTNLDSPDYIASNPLRKAQIESAETLLRAFDENRGARHRELAALLENHHRDRTVLAMTLNRGFTDLLLNWVESCDRHHLEIRSWTLIAAMDKETAELFERQGFTVFVPVPDYGSPDPRAANRYGDVIFSSMMFPKTALVQDLLCLGYDVLFQDVDVVWRKDPCDFLLHPDRRMLDAQFMYDGPNGFYAPLHANSGFFHLRNTPRSRAFWQVVHDNLDKVLSYGSQQRVVNMTLVHHYFQGLRLDVLPEAEFANGHLFTNRNVSRLPTDPYVIHNSWTDNLEHKMEKYRLAGIWYL